MTPMNLQTRQNPSDRLWYVHGFEEPMGPYDTKKEADEDRRGCQRTIRDNPEIVANAARDK